METVKQFVRPTKGETVVIYPTDKKDFDLKIAPEVREGKLLNVFCSFTYITPNYSVLFTLEKLKKFADSGNYKVLIVLWDMNTIANPYFRKLSSVKKITDVGSYIDQKVKEVEMIAKSIGFDKEKFSVYKSSELWRRLISYKEEDLFQQFYSILAQMKTTSFSVSGDKISHLIQIPIDIFFCTHFHKLYPEDLDKAVDLAFFGQSKEDLYLITRELMIKNGLIEQKNPLFIMMKHFFYLVHNENVPEWNMPLRDIKDIIAGCNVPKNELFNLFEHLEQNAGALYVKESKEELTYEAFYKKFKDKEINELSRIFADNLYSYLQDRKKRYLEVSGQIEEAILNVSKKKDVRDIGSMLKSTIALEILLKADGTRTTTDMSKELGKSVATISTYANKLKKLGMIRVLEEGKLKRNIKGVKINLELGI